MRTKRYIATHQVIPRLADMERSQAWLARKIGVSRALMNAVVQGDRTLAQDKALSAAVILGGSTDALDTFFASTDDDSACTGVAA